MNAARKSTITHTDVESTKAKPHSTTTLIVVDKNKPTTLQAELKCQNECYYLCTTHTDGFQRVQSRFLLALVDQADFKRKFEGHFHGYIKIGRKGKDGHVLKSSSGKTLAVVSKISREKHDAIKSYLESSDLSLLQS
jgi:hypothetical protein